MGHNEVDGLLDGDVVVQEKLDGANLTIAWDGSNGGLVIASRNRTVYSNSTTHDAFNGAVEWVLLSDIPDFLYNNPELVLRGEWLVKHGIKYDDSCLRRFYVFDVQDSADDGRYLHPDEYGPMLEEYGITRVPEIARLSSPTLADIISYTTGESVLSPAVEREGVVIKRYDFRNCYGRPVWGKLVSADFKEAKKVGKRSKYAASEAAFAELVTQHFVMKELYKIKDRVGSVSIENMSELLGRVWSAAFHELLWTFVKKRSVKEFSFTRARQLVYKQARGVALDYFNGVMEVKRNEEMVGDGGGGDAVDIAAASVQG
jgi:hypothetical protein